MVEHAYERRERHTYLLQAQSGLERYRSFQQANPTLWPRIPQKHIARHLDLTPSALNRLIAGAGGSN